MGRNSNDDRSDSMNPNNDAYWASLENHHSQLGDSDDCEGPSYSRRTAYRNSKIDDCEDGDDGEGPTLYRVGFAGPRSEWPQSGEPQSGDPVMPIEMVIQLPELQV